MQRFGIGIFDFSIPFTSSSILQLQYSEKLHAPALIWTSIFTLAFSLLYSLWFWWYTPPSGRGALYRLTAAVATVTAGLYAYGAQGDGPDVMYRLGMVLTVLALAFIALPLAQLVSWRKVERFSSFI